MKNVTVFSGGWTVLSVGLAALALAGCSPTYGTGTPASVQLLDDLSSAASIEGQQNTDIAYRPRPGLVPPPQEGALPAPQTSVAETERWPESPEETRARLRAEAAVTGNSALSANDPNLPGAGAGTVTVGGAANGPPAPGSLNDPQSRQRYLDAQQVARATSPTERNYLSEPPLEYRRPAESAPVGELGETERTKQRRREAIAERGEGGGWWPF
jgi:hypothetical protein